MLYNINHQFKNEDNNLAKIYNSVYKFIRHFTLSKHPSTVCWLLEILFILSTKFTANDAYKQENKLRKDYMDLLTALLTNTAAILSDTFNIEFDKSYGFKIVYAPTVYELLRRFEFIIDKFNNNQLGQMNPNSNNGASDVTNNFLRKAGFRPNDDSYDDDDFDEDEEMKFEGLKQNPNEAHYTNNMNKLAPTRFSQIGTIPISIDCLFQE
jgi:hypothetical protein